MTIDLDRMPLVINAVQALALAALLERGEHTGTTIAPTEPPERVTLVTGGELHDPIGPEPQHRTRVHTLLVAADDGRTWSIVAAGICWPAR